MVSTTNRVRSVFWALAGVLVLLLAGVAWYAGPWSGASSGPRGAEGAPVEGCVAPADREQQDVDPEDSPEYPWPHEPGEPVQLSVATAGLPARYGELVTQAAEIWTRSPCVELVVVDECPADSFCSTVIARERGDSDDTDGESESVDRDGLRESNTITLYTGLLDESSDNGALATIVHELGHALGLVHRNDRDSVMNAETDDDTNAVPDAVDFANLTRLYG